MRQDIRDENNFVVGYLDDGANEITYFTYKYGIVGTFHKDTKQYTRWKTYPGADTSPWNGQDWGMVDVLYWSKH